MADTDRLSQLLNDYTVFADSYKLKHTTKDLIQKVALLSSDGSIDTNDVLNASKLTDTESYKDLIVNVKALSNEFELLQDALSPSLEDSIDNQENIHDITNTSCNSNDDNKKLNEMKQLEHILSRLKVENEITQKAIVHKSMKIKEIQESVAITCDVTNSITINTIAPIAATMKTVDIINAVKQQEAHTKAMKELKETKQGLEELYDGIKNLNGITSFDVVCVNNDVMSLKIIVEFDTCKVCFLLNNSKELCEINLLEALPSSNVSVASIDRILEDARMLSAPQDLRYAMFAVKASQSTVASLQQHLSELRKTCIVKLLSPLSIQVTLINGLTATISIHQCYPDVPGVHIDTLSGCGDASECLRTRNNLNSKCHNNICDLVQDMLQ